MLLGLPLLALSGCVFREACPGNDSAASDWMRVRIDHQEQAGQYTYEFQAGSSNTCTFTAPLGDADPVCDLQGPAVEVQLDADGVTSITATVDEGEPEDGYRFRATRDGEVLTDTRLEPEWAATYGEKGCYRHHLGTVTISF